MTYISQWLVRWYPNKNRRKLPLKFVDEVAAVLNPIVYKLNRGQAIELKPKQAIHKSMKRLLESGNKS